MIKLVLPSLNQTPCGQKLFHRTWQMRLENFNATFHTALYLYNFVLCVNTRMPATLRGIFVCFTALV